MCMRACVHILYVLVLVRVCGTNFWTKTKLSEPKYKIHLSERVLKNTHLFDLKAICNNATIEQCRAAMKLHPGDVQAGANYLLDEEEGKKKQRNTGDIKEEQCKEGTGKESWESVS